MKLPALKKDEAGPSESAMNPDAVAVAKKEKGFRTNLVGMIMKHPKQEAAQSSEKNDADQEKDVLKRYYYYISNGIDTLDVTSIEES